MGERNGEVGLVPELTMAVAVEPARAVGSGPFGFRRVAAVTGGTVTGRRLNGTITGPGADWVLVGADGFSRLDVRFQIVTDDGATVFVRYEGLLELNAAVGAALAERDAETDWDDQYFRTAPRFECGSTGYEWLHSSLFVARGRVAAGGVEYEVYRLT